jgi:hypothetical protein
MNSSHRKSKVGIAMVLESLGVGGTIYQSVVPAHAASQSELTPPAAASDQGFSATQSAKQGEEFPDVAFARKAMAKQDVSLAIDYLDRQLIRSPGDGKALALLAKCVRASASDACGREGQMEAESLLSLLSDRVKAARQARFQPDSPDTALDDLVARDHDIQQIGESITASADEQAGPHIDAALRLDYEAHYHWYTFCSNDRDKVREGFRELRWVHDRGSALSSDTKGRYQQAVDQLKSLISDSEWEPLLQEAGYAGKVVEQ